MMIIRIIMIILSIICSIIPSIFMKIKLPKQLYIPVLLFVGSFIVLYLLYFTILFFIGKIYQKKKNYSKQSKSVNFIFNQTLEIVCHFARIKVKTTGLEKVPNNQKFMLVYNHRSNFDPMIESLMFKKQKLIHISKKENFSIPIAGGFIFRQCYLYLDRENLRSSVEVINKAINYIKEDKYSIGVAPEGTRNKENIPLLPFKHGTFRIALLSKCPIVICSLHDFEKIHKNFPFKSSKVSMNVLQVLNYEDYKDLNTAELSEKVYNVLYEDLKDVYK